MPKGRIMARGYRAVLSSERGVDSRASLDRLFHGWLHDIFAVGGGASSPHVTTRASTDSALFYHREGSHGPRRDEDEGDFRRQAITAANLKQWNAPRMASTG